MNIHKIYSGCSEIGFLSLLFEKTTETILKQFEIYYFQSSWISPNNFPIINEIITWNWSFEINKKVHLNFIYWYWMYETSFWCCTSCSLHQKWKITTNCSVFTVKVPMTHHNMIDCLAVTTESEKHHLQMYLYIINMEIWFSMSVTI